MLPGQLAIATALLAAAPGQVMAQAAPAATGSGQAGGTDGGPNDGGEIIVTASKRAEVARDVPNAVSAIDGGKLTALGFVGQQDLAKLVPGLTIAGSSNGLGGSVIIRGITTSTAQASATVGTVIDGVPIGSSTGFGLFPFPVDVNFFDLQRVEVLRGPQGTLYGANTLAGLVSYVTKAPSLTTTSGGVDVRLSQVTDGGFGYNASGGVTTALIQDKLGIRLSGYYDRVPGFLDNPELGIKNINSVRSYGGRASILAAPVDNLKIGLTFNYQKVNGRSDDGVNYSYATQQPVYGPLVQNLSVPQAFTQDFKQVYGTIYYTTDFATLSSITAYSRTKSRKDYEYGGPVGAFDAAVSGGAAPTSLLITPVDTGKFSQEVRLTSPDSGHFRWIVGGFFTHEDTTVDQRVIGITADNRYYAPLNPAFRALIPTTFQEYAGFANATYDLTSKLQVGGGVRVSHDQQTYQSMETGPLAVAIGASAASLVARSSETVATYSGFVRYTVAHDTNVYFRTSTGYRPGGPNLVVPGLPATFKSDRLTNYELGLKTSFWQNRVSIDFTGFYELYRNIQLETESASGLAYEANGQLAKSKGIEFSTVVKPFAGLTAGANFTLLDAHLVQAVPDLGAIAGERLPGTAHFTGAFTLDYRQPLQGEYVGFIGTIVSYSGVRMASFINDVPAPQYPLRAYTLAEVHFGVARRNTTLTLSVNNLTNSRAELSNTENLAQPLIAIAPPRTYSVAIRQLF